MSVARTALLLVLLMSTLAPLAKAQPREPPPPPAPTPTVPIVARGERTLRVEGLGEVKVEPDEAFMDLGMETLAPTAKAAAEENARKMEKVVGALVKAGIPREEIETRNYTVSPEYQPPTRADEAPKLKGYRVSNTVEVHVRELARVGPLLDTALNAGANRVESVRFGLSKPEVAQGEALRNAVERARQSAQVLASSLGVRLGPVLDASTVTEPQRPIPVVTRFEMASAAGARDATTPIQPQEQTIQATVTLVFAIEQGPGR
ncbi:SIMPL domain-containing protein [Archangium violaceum]|uniref:SIMPL domain-containing protein n=1 Tax=Archangium violaceum TaxID=83451 RepID=UPI001951975E|nr:SIMPL domain-containing protein [Archangium violaceum]QRN98103.1 SIMPL domain-containing protein [Archangium violaceum]